MAPANNVAICTSYGEMLTKSNYNVDSMVTFLQTLDVNRAL